MGGQRGQTDVEGYLDRIAERVRLWRAEEGLTLQQVAARGAVAASTIQKVERQQMVPTVAVLFKIARGLGKSAAELVDDRLLADDIVHVRADEDASAVPATRPLTGGLARAQLTLWRVVQRPGQGAEVPRLGPRGEVVILCESGHVDVTEGQSSHRLAPGDSLHCKTRQGLAWRVVGDEPSSFLLIGTDALGLDHVLGAIPTTRAGSSTGPA